MIAYIEYIKIIDTENLEFKRTRIVATKSQ